MKRRFAFGVMLAALLAFCVPLTGGCGVFCGDEDTDDCLEDVADFIDDLDISVNVHDHDDDDDDDFGDWLEDLFDDDDDHHHHDDDDECCIFGRDCCD